MQNSGQICEYIWTQLDCGLIYVNRRGSLTKFPGRTGILIYRPLDRDRVALVRWDPVLILRVGSGSSGRGLLAGRGRHWVAVGHFLRRRGTGSSPDFGASVFPCSKRNGSGSERDYATCVVHLGQDLGTSRSVAARTGTAAALGDYTRRRAAFYGL